MYCIMNEFIMCEDLWNTKKAQLFKRIMIFTLDWVQVHKSFPMLYVTKLNFTKNKNGFNSAVLSLFSCTVFDCDFLVVEHNTQGKKS